MLEGLRPSLKSHPPLLLKGEGDKGGEVNKQSQSTLRDGSPYSALAPPFWHSCHSPEGSAQWLTLAYRNGCACGFGDEFAVLVGHNHLGDANPSPTPYYPTLGNQLIIYPGTSDEVDVELRGYAGMG